jgi:hypothetical protein
LINEFTSQVWERKPDGIIYRIDGKIISCNVFPIDIQCPYLWSANKNYYLPCH